MNLSVPHECPKCHRVRCMVNGNDMFDAVFSWQSLFTISGSTVTSWQWTPTGGVNRLRYQFNSVFLSTDDNGGRVINSWVKLSGVFKAHQEDWPCSKSSDRCRMFDGFSHRRTLQRRANPPPQWGLSAQTEDSAIFFLLMQQKCASRPF